MPATCGSKRDSCSLAQPRGSPLAVGSSARAPSPKRFSAKLVETIDRSLGGKIEVYAARMNRS
jgi:hypothetical protein